MGSSSSSSAGKNDEEGKNKKKGYFKELWDEENKYKDLQQYDKWISIVTLFILNLILFIAAIVLSSILVYKMYRLYVNYNHLNDEVSKSTYSNGWISCDIKNGEFTIISPKIENLVSDSIMFDSTQVLGPHFAINSDNDIIFYDLNINTNFSPAFIL